jgi:hypothetical protein
MQAFVIQIAQHVLIQSLQSIICLDYTWCFIQLLQGVLYSDYTHVLCQFMQGFHIYIMRRSLFRLYRLFLFICYRVFFIKIRQSVLIQLLLDVLYSYYSNYTGCAYSADTVLKSFGSIPLCIIYN